MSKYVMPESVERNNYNMENTTEKETDTKNRVICDVYLTQTINYSVNCVRLRKPNTFKKIYGYNTHEEIQSQQLADRFSASAKGEEVKVLVLKDILFEDYETLRKRYSHDCVEQFAEKFGFDKIVKRTITATANKLSKELTKDPKKFLEKYVFADDNESARIYSRIYDRGARDENYFPIMEYFIEYYIYTPSLTYDIHANGIMDNISVKEVK